MGAQHKLLHRKTFSRNGKRRRGDGLTMVRRFLRGVRIKELATAPVRIAGLTTALEDLCTIFLNDEVAVVAVCDDARRFRGTVHRASLIRHAIERCDAHRRRPCRFSTCPLVDANVQLSPWTMRRRISADPALTLLTARDLMDTSRTSVGPDASVGQAVAAMESAGIQVLPIIDREKGGELVGLVSMQDVLCWFAGVSSQRASKRRRWR